MLFIRDALETPKRPKVILISLWHASSRCNLEGDYETQPQSELYLVFPCFSLYCRVSYPVVPVHWALLHSPAKAFSSLIFSPPPPPPPSSLLLHLTNDHDAFQKLFILDTSIHSTQQLIIRIAASPQNRSSPILSQK